MSTAYGSLPVLRIPQIGEVGLIGRISRYCDLAAAEQASFGPFGRCSGEFGSTSAQVRTGQAGAVANPLTGLHQGISSPLVSG